MLQQHNNQLCLFSACFNGLYNAMFSTILIDVIGMGKFQSSLGFVTLVHGISIAIFFPISGKLFSLTELQTRAMGIYPG